MSIALDSALKRKNNLETEMGKLALRIKQSEKTLSDLQVAHMFNEQVIRDLETDAAIEKAKKSVAGNTNPPTPPPAPEE